MKYFTLLFPLSQLPFFHEVHVGWATRSPSFFFGFLPLLSLWPCPCFTHLISCWFSGVQTISTRLVPITTVFPVKGAKAVGFKVCVKLPLNTAANSKRHYHDGYFVFEEN